MKARISAKQYFENLAASQQRQQRLKAAAAKLAQQQQSQSAATAPNPEPPKTPQPSSTEPRSTPPVRSACQPPSGLSEFDPIPSANGTNQEEPAPAEPNPAGPPLSNFKSQISNREAPAFGGREPSSSTHPRRCRPRGRPSTFSEDLADAIFDAICDYGHTDTAAAAKFGVAASTLSCWKRENEWFATDLEAARAEYKERILAEIRNAKKRDGSPDWRAYAWILERTFPDEFGRRTRKPPEPERKPTVDEYLDITPEEVLSPEKIERLRQAHEELVNDPESWEHKQILTRAQERFEEMKAAFLRGAGGE